MLRSFSMVLASGQEIMKEYNVHPIILDCDEENGDTKIANACIKCYHTIHNIAWKDEKMAGAKEANGFFRPALAPLPSDEADPQNNFRMIYAPGQITFADFINYNQLKIDETNTKLNGGKVNDKSRTRLLLNSLYNTDATSDDSELYLNMQKGFKGNPNVGSLVFHDIDTECNEFKMFLNTITNDDRIIVVGSLFGGTGSSGIPEIIHKIKNKLPEVKTGAVLMMPYFAPSPKNGGTIRKDIFNSKTKAALNYYKGSGLLGSKQNSQNKKGKINNSYFIGNQRPTIVPYHDGGEDQKNPANIVEFIGALSILHFAAGIEEGAFKYGVNQYITGDDAVKQLFYDDLSDDFSKPVIKRFTAFAIGLKYFVTRMLHPDSKLRSTTYFSRFELDKILTGQGVKHPTDRKKEQMQEMLASLSDFWGLFKTWQDELSSKNLPEDKANTPGLTLFDTEVNTDVLIVRPVGTTQTEKPTSPFGRLFNHESPNEKSTNKGFNPLSMDGAINESLKNYEKNIAGGQYITKDEEYLLLNGLYEASIDKAILENIIK